MNKPLSRAPTQQAIRDSEVGGGYFVYFRMFSLL